METVIQMRHAMAANWKRGGTFFYCTYCLKRGRTLRWFRRHWVRAHCRAEVVQGTPESMGLL